VLHQISCTGMALFVFACAAPSQQLVPGNPVQPGTVATSENQSLTPPESKRILGIIPNYRTSPTLAEFEPITPREKFKLASEDAFDRGTFVLAAMFAGEAQLTNSNRSFGQGAAGFGKYFGASYADFAIGDYMTEGIFPSLLHQDPRYFRRGVGSTRSRLGYAMGQIFLTHGDSGDTQFNFSEIVGNSTAVAISNAYYSNNRSASDAVSKLSMQFGVDMAANVLKEFWPDIERKLSRKNHQHATALH
jgi:hypothetical protein